MNNFTTISVPVKLSKEIEEVSLNYPKKKKYEVIQLAINKIKDEDDMVFKDLVKMIKETSKKIKVKKKFKLSDIKIEDAYLD